MFSLSSLSLNHKYIYVAGDIGGQMGLFIGASILTILELFDYAYEVKHTDRIQIHATISINKHTLRRGKNGDVFRDTRAHRIPPDTVIAVRDISLSLV